MGWGIGFIKVSIWIPIQWLSLDGNANWHFNKAYSCLNSFYHYSDSKYLGLYIGIKIVIKTINNIPLYWDSFAMNPSINILDCQWNCCFSTGSFNTAHYFIRFFAGVKVMLALIRIIWIWNESYHYKMAFGLCVWTQT